MRILLKILNYFFVVLGVLFFVIILIGVYLFKADPFGVKPLFSNLGILPNTTPTTTSSGTADKNLLLSPEQEKTLESMGINPATLPSAVTPELEACFTQKLGTQRVNEIKKGSTVTPLDLLKAGLCVK